MFSAEGIAAFAVKCLAVAGAFVVGYALIGLIVFALDRWLAGGKTNKGFKRVLRMLGGLAAALLAAYVLFYSSGGKGLFGGGSDANTGTGAPAAPASTTEQPATPTPPKTPEVPLSPTDRVVRITVLGGSDVKDQRFYLIDDNANPLTFDEAKPAILARKPTDMRKLRLEIVFPEKNALPPEHEAVDQLDKWARANDIQPLQLLK